MSRMQNWLVDGLNRNNLTPTTPRHSQEFSLLDRQRLIMWQRRFYSRPWRAGAGTRARVRARWRTSHCRHGPGTGVGRGVAGLRGKVDWVPDARRCSQNHSAYSRHALLVRNRIDRSVLVQTISSVDETRWFLDLAGEHSFVADRSKSPPTHWGPVCRTGHPRSRWPTHQRRCAGDFPGPGRPILDIRARQLPTLEFSRAAYFWLGILARTSLSVAAGILSTSSSMRACRSANSCLNTCPNFKSAWSLILKAPILVLRSPRRRSANFRSLVFNERRNCLPALLTRA